MDCNQVLLKAIALKDFTGEKLRRSTKPVESTNESIRGIFSNIHSNKIDIGLEGMVDK